MSMYISLRSTYSPSLLELSERISFRPRSSNIACLRSTHFVTASSNAPSEFAPLPMIMPMSEVLNLQVSEAGALDGIARACSLKPITVNATTIDKKIPKRINPPLHLVTLGNATKGPSLKMRHILQGHVPTRKFEVWERKGQWLEANPNRSARIGLAAV